MGRLKSCIDKTNDTERDAVATLLAYDVVVSKFELQLGYYVKFTGTYDHLPVFRWQRWS